MTPAQSVQVELSPSQTPHSSSSALPFGTLAQSTQVELSPPQTPHSSINASPLGTPEQSEHEVLSPPHTSHSSYPFGHSGSLIVTQSPTSELIAFPFVSENTIFSKHVSPSPI